MELQFLILNSELSSEFSKIFNSLDVLQKIYKRTGMLLQFVPLTDPNRMSILFYEKPKDGINWHYDGNNYYGQRWAGIFTIENNGFLPNTFSSAKFNYDDGSGSGIRTIDTKENSLILFRGDVVKHKVDNLQNGEKRTVVSLLFCDVCERTQNPIALLYQMGVNLVFYGHI